MKYIRRSGERGYVEGGWLKSFHSFSFGEYYDPQFMGYKTLRVINHDFIDAASGFPLHGHRDMEIITYVLDGVVEHQDSLGNKAQTMSGDVQVMHAGRGIRHSEYNPSPDKVLELLQIWVIPTETGLDPGYTQKQYSREEKLNQLKLVASPSGDDGSLKIHAQAKLYASVLEQESDLKFSVPDGHGVWIQVAKGSIQVQGEILNVGDGMVLQEESALEIKGQSTDAEFLLFDLW